MYVCGITPYDTTHLGHAFTYVAADILLRYLEYQGHRVRYVQNVTDIDDDILKKAHEVDEDWRILGNQWTEHFIRDMISLNVRPPDAYPRATETIPEIIDLVQRLLKAGVAYRSGNSVYYDISQWPAYGKLSHLPREEMLPIANQRGNRPEDPHKKHPLDFVLWQARAPGEPSWASPWGPGRPGWHIECSAMSTSLLGGMVDIHMGGADLIFPHHESEIAQVEPLTGESAFVRYWAHTAMVHHEGEKMSKSLGNLVMVRDLLKDWPSDALRVYLASHHYRQVWSYDEADLKQARELAGRLWEAANVSAGMGESLDHHPYRLGFLDAMDNDLDTPGALQALENLAREILDAARDGKDIQRAQAELRELCGLFGLRLDEDPPEPDVLFGWEKHLQRFPTKIEDQ
jgi:L-cysteine:1D-myo-inositol 2-amino-2-deoxy-alpha-D-glucopyranoside ligase